MEVTTWKNSYGNLNLSTPGGGFSDDLWETLTYGKLLKHES